MRLLKSLPVEFKLLIWKAGNFLFASKREILKDYSSLILGIGFLMCAFTAKKQCLYDMMATALLFINAEIYPESP